MNLPIIEGLDLRRKRQAEKNITFALRYGSSARRMPAYDLHFRPETGVAWRRIARDGTAYQRKPIETEANSYMAHNDEIPLAR